MTNATETTKTFTKTTSKGFVLVATRTGKSLSVTVDGQSLAKISIRYYDAPKELGGKICVAQIDKVALTRDELVALEAVVFVRKATPAADPSRDHAIPMTRELGAELRDWHRGQERKLGLEEE